MAPNKKVGSKFVRRVRKDTAKKTELPSSNMSVIAEEIKQKVFKKPAAHTQESEGVEVVPDAEPGLAVQRYKKLEEDLRSKGDLSKTEKTMLLDAKCAAYKETGGKGINFSTPEMRCLYNRWSETALPSAPDSIRTMWTGVLMKKRGENKEIAKRAMVFAWVRDETFSDTFFQLTDQVTTSLDLSRKGEWLSKKEIHDKYGDETDNMISDGTIRVRVMPNNPKYKEYLKVTDSSTASLQRIQRMSAVASSKLKKDEFKEIQGSLRSQQLTDRMLDMQARDGDLRGFADQEIEDAQAEAAETDDDSNADDEKGDTKSMAGKSVKSKDFSSTLTPMQRRLLLKMTDKDSNPEPPNEPPQKNNKLDIDALAAGTAELELDQAHMQVNLMASAVDRLHTSLLAEQHKAKDFKYKPDKQLVKDLGQSLINLAMHRDKLKLMTIKQAGSIKQVTQALKSAAEAVKEGERVRKIMVNLGNINK